MSPKLRKTVLVVHRWTGMTVGLVFLMLALTAAILVFRQQLEPVVSSSLFASGNCVTRVPLDTAVANAVQAHPGAKLDDIRIRTAGEPTQVRFLDREQVYVDPCSGKVLGMQNKWSGFFGFPEKLHRFKFIEGETGALLDGFVTLAVLVLLVIGGVIVWWPSTRMAWKGGFKFRPHLKGTAFILNLHNVTGIYTCIVLFITALTAMPISFTTVREGLYSLTSSQRIAKPSSAAPAGRNALALESFWQRAQAVFPGSQEGVLRIPRKPTDAIEVFTIDADASHPNARNYVYFDAYSGSLLQSISSAQSPMGLRIYFWIISLHTGAVGGPLVQLLFLLGMLGVPVLAYTGFASYLKRRAQAAAQPEPALARVLAIRDETEEIKSFRFARVDGKPLKPFGPGAHISVQIPDGLTRQYSLINGPGERDAYHIAVKREPESRGGSRALHDRVTTGETLMIAGPRNHFPLERSAKHHVLLAAGIGITPLYSMAKHLVAEKASFELHYFTRSVKHTAFHEELSTPDFAGKVDFHYALDPESLRTYLHKLLRERRAGAHLYMCGPRPFMALVEEIAGAAWPPEAIHMEYFSADPLASSGPRTPFRVELARSRKAFDVPAEKSILEVLAQQGVNVVSSCAQGVCGTCITGLLGGDPDHRDAFLSEAERVACDKIMLCVSRAKSERLVLDL
jgi:vanillate O-demethylase ferredoxin subunit